MISRNACYWIWITLSIGYNNPKVKRISEMYSDVSAFYYGGISEWRLCGIFSQKDIERFSSTGLDDAKKIVDRCIECNYSILCIDDELFPKCLYNIECPPALIYINGVMPDIDNTFSIGIVGTRRATKYGIENSYRFAYALSKYGTIIVSGGAVGVDGASHRGALATDGITICVRGCGLNCSYLRENSDIRSTIPKRGAVITEYPPDETPRNYYFPARNRIIAALSDGLLVMEAGKKSGSLITANLAAEQGKTIFALLGNNSPQNEGSNALIKEGLAIPVTDFMDILCEFDSLYATTDDEFDIDNISLADTGNFPVKGIRKQAPARIYVNKQNDQQPAKTAVPYVSEKSETVVQKPVHKENLNLPKTAQDVYEYIGNEPVHIDKISADLKIPVFKVLTALTMLEMKDLVSALQGRNYILK